MKVKTTNDGDCHMRLLDFLIEYTKTDRNPTRIISAPELRDIRGKLMNLDEFKNVTKLCIVDYEEDRESTKTTKLIAGVGFEGVMVLCGLALTPMTYDPKKFNEFQSGLLGYMSPSIYDTQYCPYKIVSLKLTPENQHNVEGLHNLLTDVLDNADKYTPKGDRGVILSGAFTYDDR